MTSFDDFPPGSILSEMRLDLYASKRSGEITMFYEGEFYKDLTRLEFNPATADLYFVFDGKLRVPLGAPLMPELAKYVAKAKQVAAFQVTLEGQPGSAQFVPLQIIGA